VKFILLAEGRTEKQAVGTFLKRWLDEQLKPTRVRVQVESFAGSGRFVREFAERARLHLSPAPATEIIGVIGLLDLYKYPCPADPKAFETQVGDDNFRMFFAVHESEAWLLSEPNILPRMVRDALPSRMSDKPEAVNTNRPPSKLLDELFGRGLNRAYKKISHGQQLFARLNPEVARTKCPKLREMLDAMLSMAKAAGL
jgi:hypothetical protein